MCARHIHFIIIGATFGLLACAGDGEGQRPGGKGGGRGPGGGARR